MDRDNDCSLKEYVEHPPIYYPNVVTTSTDDKVVDVCLTGTTTAWSTSIVFFQLVRKWYVNNALMLNLAQHSP